MAYEDEILKKLANSDNWPSFERPDYLTDLNLLADNSFDTKTIEGYLASVLIYQQLTEEFIRILIECSTFYIQLKVFPQEFQNRSLKKKMFGQLIQELTLSVIDENIRQLAELANDLNNTRIQIVHKLTKNDTINQISEQCESVKATFDKIWELFDDVYDNYQVTFKDFRKDIDDFKDLIGNYEDNDKIEE
ncbi:MAG TPA: hypothetical protein P5564_05275 [Paludibacteraceae bacterium]|jgi:hypothetical protein|nr:hypothetical protein [Paludibacteraceae bacterium]HRS68000.1 hypothetical protein [Paludibacteraceae bacterium]